MKTLLTKNENKESRFSLSTLTAPAALLTAIMTIALLLPTSFAANSNLASQILPSKPDVMVTGTTEELPAKWNMKKAAVNLNQMYRNSK